jgi:hypothetical protein
VKASELRVQVEIELEGMAVVVNELVSLQRDVDSREPTLREKTAAAAFLAQFYSGLENTLKRISQYHDIEIPSGDNWHIELFQRFCAPVLPGLPVLFSETLAVHLAPYRRFRHVALHSYGFQLDWERMQEGITALPVVFVAVQDTLFRYLRFIEI